jgi:hypothetical protein
VRGARSSAQVSASSRVTMGATRGVQLRHRQSASAGQRMRGGGHHHQFVVQQDVELPSRRQDRRAATSRRVDVPACDPDLRLRSLGVGDEQAHTRLGLHQGRQQRGHQPVQRRGGGCHAHHLARVGQLCGHTLDAVGQRRQHTARHGKQLLCGLGRPDATRMPVEERGAQQRFKVRQGMRDGRLRHPHRCRRAPQAAQLGHCGQYLQVTQPSPRQQPVEQGVG